MPRPLQPAGPRVPATLFLLQASPAGREKSTPRGSRTRRALHSPGRCERSNPASLLQYLGRNTVFFWAVGRGYQDQQQNPPRPSTHRQEEGEEVRARPLHIPSVMGVRTGAAAPCPCGALVGLTRAVLEVASAAAWRPGAAMAVMVVARRQWQWRLPRSDPPHSLPAHTASPSSSSRFQAPAGTRRYQVQVVDAARAP